MARQTPFKYPAFSFTQRAGRAPHLVLFHAPVREVLEWAKPFPLGPGSSGPQREKREAKTEAIFKFLGSNQKNTIPSAIVLLFQRRGATFIEGKGKSGTLAVTVPRGAPTTSIVDGQHRLFGIGAFDADMHVPIVGLLEADDVEEHFQFLVINNKATKVPVTHTKALLARMAQTALPGRLKAAGLAFDADGIKDVDLVDSDRDSPFYQCIDWPTNSLEQRMVAATAIELSLEYLKGLGKPELDDRDTRRSVFLAIWRTVKRTWPQLWVQGSRLVSKIGIVVLTRFVSDLIVSWSDSDELDIDVADLTQIENQSKRILKYMNELFWVAPWAEKAQGGFDTNQGRDRVLQALKQLYRNGKSQTDWYVDIDIIDASSVDGGAAPTRKKAAKRRTKSKRAQA